MPRLLIAAAAAVGAVLFWRRKTVKDDAAKITESAKSGATQVSATAKEKASQISDRVRGESGGKEPTGEDAVIDVATAEEESSTEGDKAASDEDSSTVTS